MNNARVTVPAPRNEPVLNYAPGSPEKAALRAQLDTFAADSIEIPLIIGGRNVTTGDLGTCILPHDHRRSLATYHKGNAETVNQAIAAAADARAEWSAMPWESRAAIWLKAAELLAGRYRQVLNAATMLNQSKTAFQAEIDAACELSDFWRFNASYLPEIYAQQPASAPGMWNYVEYRALEGFIFAATPFNFTSIAGNLPTSPALMGNTVVWKPASTAVFAAYYLMQLFEEAGLPAGVINLVPGSGGEIGDPAMAHPDLGGVHFTGSTAVFQGMWRTVGANIAGYKSYPRIVGETGGKDFVVAHPECDEQGLLVALLRGSFEFQGQKCSAASRAYVPKSVWSHMGQPLCDEIAKIKMGDARDFSNFMTAVIDQRAFDKITGYIERAKASDTCDVVVGGGSDDSDGWFIEPTIIVTSDPKAESMVEEIFGPVLTVFLYENDDFEGALEMCDEGSLYALTGSIFATKEADIQTACDALRFTAGNFYINDKPTGAVVAQQPFGGARASGTNDKAGSPLNLLRWISPRSIKRALDIPQEWGYPFLAPDE